MDGYEAAMNYKFDKKEILDAVRRKEGVDHAVYFHRQKARTGRRICKRPLIVRCRRRVQVSRTVVLDGFHVGFWQ